MKRKAVKLVRKKKINPTWPSSSFRLDVLAAAGVSVGAWYISRSLLMKVAWMKRTTSIVTCSEIGIKLLNRMMNVSRL